MTRPLMQLNLDSLERYFAESLSDEHRLGMLIDELSMRQTPRARDLLKRATDALDRVWASVDTKPPAELALVAQKLKQQKLMPTESCEGEIPEFLKQLPTISIAPRDAPPPRTPRTVPQVREPQLTLSQAVDALRVSETSPWEAIEDARRNVVARSSPFLLAHIAESAALSRRQDADRANEAYEVLRRARGITGI